MSVTSAAGSRRIRVLIVDDSLFMRAAIAKALANGPFEVIGQAKDGNDALAQIVRLQPDVVTMDFNMPGMNGVETVRALMQQRPTPVVMFSAHTKQGAKETFDALAAGAVDFVTKPAGEVSVDLSKIAEELTRKLIAASSARPRAAPPPQPPTRTSGPIGIPRATLSGGLPRLCVIAISTGGPAALSEVVPALPADLRLAIVVVQHMPAGFTGPLAERLDAASRVSVREAQTGDRPLAGSVLIAPGDRHLEFDERGMVVLTEGPLVNGCRPAADVTMLSAAKVYGRRTLGVVMTGMGKDGAAGALAIKKVEGKTCAQDQLTSVIYGMPKAAVDVGAIDEVVPLADIAGWLRYA
ncbi:MAG: chemotaxis response regulator protein-glutamate methylesterase [Deltaproteobacteria bacterium]|nr:chemotaxis response regulator protein-glutamate methylesterase [Deltaproteobacteria bacterium]MDQ3300524.1 chemotaxis response regulator protein-glutamate methylesterase [Myxococcota bacterium]